MNKVYINAHQISHILVPTSFLRSSLCNPICRSHIVHRVEQKHDILITGQGYQYLDSSNKFEEADLPYLKKGIQSYERLGSVINRADIDRVNIIVLETSAVENSIDVFTVTIFCQHTAQITEMGYLTQLYIIQKDSKLLAWVLGDFHNLCQYYLSEINIRLPQPGSLLLQ